MTLRHITPSLLFLIAASTFADSKITPYVQEGNLGSTFEWHDLPRAALEKSFQSGFTTFLLFRVRLTQKEKEEPILLKDFSYSVFYDLWEEIYRITALTPMHDLIQSPRPMTFPNQFKNLDQTLQHLRRSHFFPLGEQKKWNLSIPTTIEIQVLVDPLQKDKVNLIRKWIAEAQVPSGLDTTSKTDEQGRLLRVLLDEYLEGNLSTVKWSHTYHSSPFTNADLK